MAASEERPQMVSNVLTLASARSPLTNAITRPLKSEIPSRLKPILEINNSLQTRLAALRGLVSPLAFSEVQALYAFLYETATETGLSQGNLNALKNDLLNRLKSQEGETIPLIRHLMNLYYDPLQDEVWREYCVQHLGTVFQKAPLYQPQLVQLFDDALNQKEGSMAGTTLIAMDRNVGLAGWSAETLAEKAWAVAESPTYNAASRTTALQIAARHGDRRTLPLARAILEEKSDAHLMVSALAVLGQLGEAKAKGSVLAL